MTGRTEHSDRGKLGKSVLPATLTLLAGLGAGLFAMQPDDVPGEMLAGDLDLPVDTAATLSTDETVALVEPNFAPVAAVATPDAPSAKTMIPTAITAPVAAPNLTVAFLDHAPDPVAGQRAAAGIVQPPQAEQTDVVAASAAPIVATIAVPVVQPQGDSPANAPEAKGIAVSPIAGVLAENAVVPLERPATTPATAAPNTAAPTTTGSTPPAPVLAALAPAASEAAPAPQLAMADWNYSLPDPSSASGANAFVGGVSSAPLALVPSRATPNPASPGAVARASGASADNGAQLAAPTRKVPATVSSRRTAGVGFASALNGKNKYQLVGSEIEFQLPVLANGTPVGNLTLHVAPNQQVSLRLRELLSLFHDQIDPQTLTTLVASPSIESFVTFEKLRDAGIDIRYDAARDRLALSVEQP